MSLWQAIALGIVQGLTEFAPVSSSGHLVLVPWLLGWPEPSVAFDAMLHLGTLLAVVVYFFGDLVKLLFAWLRSIVRLRIDGPEERLGWLLILATIPGAAAGFFLGDWFESMFNQPVAVGVFLIITAVILVAAEQWKRKEESVSELKAGQALLIGLAQAVAILPGISRSGSTISTGLLVGLQRTEAARFSFLLSVPIILGAAASQAPSLLDGGDPTSTTALILGFLAATASGYLCIRFLLSFLRRHSLDVFAIYCTILGLAVILVALTGWRPA